MPGSPDDGVESDDVDGAVGEAEVVGERLAAPRLVRLSIVEGGEGVALAIG